ncbi:MAG: hypothetical protein HN640_00170 [Gammaproteobacteria bacterium]|jgi:hypothetical protein|nr:hypothetical protein [Gammaproteobacteria bacterium]MBT7322334.1 hypothetical protein [Gammaproteobacteria bacterium]MBT7931889.1 hypothetical protein [Gammaproteobacteria bacterium]|tara:strand:+ start:3998 stop:4159 length:162 start_codon:yes stop_codon:yes gene_type:complete
MDLKYQLFIRSRLAKKYHMVITGEADSGKASWSKGEAKIATNNNTAKILKSYE